MDPWTNTVTHEFRNFGTAQLNVQLPRFPEFALLAGIERENDSAGRRLILWIRDASCGDGHRWARYASIKGAERQLTESIFVNEVERTVVQLTAPNFWQRLWQPKQPAAKETRIYELPNGARGTQIGERSFGWAFAWTASSTAILEEADIRPMLGPGRTVTRLARNLLLVSGIPEAAPLIAGGVADDSGTRFNPVDEIKGLVQRAQGEGDEQRTLALMIDLGVCQNRKGSFADALITLTTALERIRRDGFAELESDALGNLALVLQNLGRHEEALSHARDAIRCAKERQNKFQEKLAHEQLGIIHAEAARHAAAIESYESARELAVQLHDVAHEADLSWYMAIEWAELEQRSKVLAEARRALSLYQRRQSPFLGWYRDRLQAFEAGHDGFPASMPQGKPANYPLVEQSKNLTTPPAVGNEGKSRTAATPLRMAISSVKAMGKYIGSGFASVSVDERRQRLEICNECEMHTGARCLVCGCITSLKSWLPHEDCPLDRWPKRN